MPKKNTSERRQRRVSVTLAIPQIMKRERISAKSANVPYVMGRGDSVLNIKANTAKREIKAPEIVNDPVQKLLAEIDVMDIRREIIELYKSQVLPARVLRFEAIDIFPREHAVQLTFIGFSQNPASLDGISWQMIEKIFKNHNIHLRFFGVGSQGRYLIIKFSVPSDI